MKIGESFPDYYQCLSLEFGANYDKIKEHFRQLAKVYHPDNPITGSKIHFQKILKAYQILTSERDRGIYDYAYTNFLENSARNNISQSRSIKTESSNTEKSKNHRSESYLKMIPPSRVVFAHNVTEYAKKGLMRKGYRMKDRTKWTGIDYDVEIKVLESETKEILRANIPLTVRILCPDCYGSDIHCSACGGGGSYKSFRNLCVDLIPNRWKNGQTIDLELSKYRPDKLTYFKKKKIKIRLSVLSVDSKSL
ncbi:MAG: DnaJ domain-containing protein [Leptospira sp.]|nr:DnaJ domain-containing protein [Leptospira sp.]